jgi:tetratricopeptide (TPR) repeat protein
VRGPTEQWLKISLLSRRAAVYREIGDLRRAREDLDAALAVTRDELTRGELSVGPGDSASNRLLFALVGVYALQAELYVDDGDPEAARATLARAIAYSPAPELNAARLADRPLLTPLLDELGLLGSVSADAAP